MIIGVGQEQRGDDAVGLLVARAIAANDAVSNGASLSVVEHGGDGLDLMSTWEGADRVVVVDAVVSGGQAPGCITRFEAHREALPARLFTGHSTHALGLAEAIEMARAMDRLPSSLVVYGVEAADFETGAAPSAAVQDAVGPVSERVLRELGVTGEGEIGQGA